MPSSIVFEVSPTAASCAQNDDCLVIAAKAGDRDAFDQLFRHHSKRIMQTLICITRNHEDAEDALQNTLLNAYLHIESFDGRSGISTWLMRIGINAGLAVLRRRRLRPHISLDHEIADNLRLEDSLHDRRVDIERHCIDREQSLLLRHAISRLSPSLREILILQHSLGCSNRELAMRTGMTVAAIKSRALRARKALGRSSELDKAVRARKPPGKL